MFVRMLFDREPQTNNYDDDDDQIWLLFFSVMMMMIMWLCYLNSLLLIV